MACLGEGSITVTSMWCGLVVSDGLQALTHIVVWFSVKKKRKKKGGVMVLQDLKTYFRENKNTTVLHLTLYGQLLSEVVQLTDISKENRAGFCWC